MMTCKKWTLAFDFLLKHFSLMESTTFIQPPLASMTNLEMIAPGVALSQECLHTEELLEVLGITAVTVVVSFHLNMQDTFLQPCILVLDIPATTTTTATTAATTSTFRK